MAGTVDDWPTVGGDEDDWGNKEKAFIARTHIMSGDKSGLLAIVVNEGRIVTNQNQPVYNIPGV